MSSFRLSRPSPALVVSIIALVAALGGTSYAAFSLPKNSVGSKQLKNNAVTTKKIKNGAVTGSKIANNTITGSRIANNTITGSKINLSTLGTVPSANHANSANFATTAGNANALQGHGASDFVSSGTLVRYHLLLSPGAPDAVVDRDGALSIVAHCAATGPEADLYVRTTLDHSSMDAWDQNNDFGPANTTVNWGAPENGSGGPVYEANVSDGVAVAPDGSAIYLVSTADGYNIGSAPGKCIFAGAEVNG
jgi:hypothetical protein